MKRRDFIGGATLGTAAMAAATTAAGNERGPRWADSYGGRDVPAQRPGQPGRDYQPVITPNNDALPFTIQGNVKVFHLVAEEVEHEFAPGLKARCWGFNGRVHGPTIEAVEGDHIRIYVTNRLPASTSIHWHGAHLPCGMDGIGGLTQRSIPVGETYRYEWVLRQHGTLMYHSHHDEMTQMALGLMGMFVIHPRNPSAEDRVDRDFALLLSEWKIQPGTYRPDPNEMVDFNVLTINAKAWPGTDPLVARTGQRVRIRVANLSAMDHHPFHVHGHFFRVTETDGGRIPLAGQWPETTVLVPTGSSRTIEFIADNPGDWAMHCHMTHHVMNQMGHGAPNMIGVDPKLLDDRIRPLVPGYMTMGHDGMGDHGQHIAHGMPVPENSIPMVGGEGPFGYITMGGMFSILKVRDGITSYADPGWFRHPEGTVASAATAAELARDGIDAPAGSTGDAGRSDDHAHHGHGGHDHGQHDHAHHDHGQHDHGHHDHGNHDQAENADEGHSGHEHHRH
ncbi:MAG: copper oxidase [Gammaproteobacteria bacterium]|nr:copper oxidase [Gammaproteobacteria bacterium]